MDAATKTFDKWALSGRSDLMQKEHSKAVIKFLKSVSFRSDFSFLDVGCGNGWVIHKISKLKKCKNAVGIDKSKNMIKVANSKKTSSKEHFFNKDLLTWKTSEKFDYVFSMESLYYSVPMEKPLKKIFSLLKPEGQFFCGTDFYKDNKITSKWSEQMNIPMDLRSKKEWKQMFEDIGFIVKTRQIKDPHNSKKWKRELGTLFVIGTKP